MWGRIFSRKSTKNSCQTSIQQERKPLKPEEFDDIFGGPPRCVFSDPSEDNMFHNPAGKNVRDLPEFEIWSTISNSPKFPKMAGESDELRKLDTTSVLNSESGFSPPTTHDDVYASKLSPIIVPAWIPSVMHGVHQDIPDFSYTSRPSFVGKQFTHNENFRSSPFISLSRRASSPDTMCRGDYSYSTVKLSVGDIHDYANKFHNNDDDDEDDDNEISRVNAFKFNYGYREGTDEGVGVDEAIAWARQSYHSHTSSSESLQLQQEYPNKIKTEMDESREMKMLEEGIKLWSCGKQRNIELLLSTLQDILWQNSGWCPIPHTNLYESSNVKKAYQRARLRLHPDKLQQRGATLSQKYIAQRIFLILQEAWDAYTSQDIISSQG